MGSMCQCLFQYCCDAHDDEEIENQTTTTMLTTTTVPQSMSREGGDGDNNINSTSYQNHSEDEPEEDLRCCRGINNGGEGGAGEHAQGIHDFFRRIRQRFMFNDNSNHVYDIMRQSSRDAEDESNYNNDDDILKPKNKKPIPPSPLRQASSFDSSTDIPCISKDEIVLPGSQLQQQMAMHLMSAKLKDDEIECVICMEHFDPTNPRMPTLCGCGENKTYFHLPCLYQWLEQSQDCPSCRKRITWEEF